MEGKIEKLRLLKSINRKEGKMKRKVVLSLAVVVLLLVVLVGGSLLTESTLAQTGIPSTIKAQTGIPSTINYQGLLTDVGTGEPITGTVDITFSLYDQPSEGALVWQETHPGVTLDNGVFNVRLGSITPIYGEEVSGERYLGVQVGTDEEMTPRQPLDSVPYAFYTFHAENTSNLEGHPASDFALASHTHTQSDITGDIDADTLDGLDSSEFAAASHSHAEYVILTGAPYRWMVFSTYSQNSGWYASNDADMFGGVVPSFWSDGNAIASQMSPDKEVLRTLFTRRGYGGKNAAVVADEWAAYSSTNGKHCAVLFRISNTSGSVINWPVSVYMTSYSGWSEYASIALNGANIWNSGATSYSPTSPPIEATLAIPPDQVSTAIFVAGSGEAYAAAGSGLHMRSLYLAFTNDCLELPEGLEFVDDLDIATGGWEQ